MIQSAIDDASEFVISEFNLNLHKSSLIFYDSEHWQQFCGSNGFDGNTEGLYVPCSYSAYVYINSPTLVSNIFHELYGHGLFCEHSQIGKQLANFTGEEAKNFLYENIPEEQSFGFVDRNIWNYEGFALWLENLLCVEVNNEKCWNLKKEKLPPTYHDLLGYFKDREQELTRFGFMSQLGFPKFYDSNKLLEVVRRIYPNGTDEIRFVVLYGSQRPSSDIDLFVVSNHPPGNYFNGWLDIYGLNSRGFEQLVEDLDISVTDPLFSGKLIFGDKNYFESARAKTLSQPITPQTIKHNLSQAARQRGAISTLRTDRDLKIADSYIDSFTRMAQSLQQGRKLLTLDALLSA